MARKIALLSPTELSPEMIPLFTLDTASGRKLCIPIRAYNSVSCFTSLRVIFDMDLASSRERVFIFHINGTIYHRIDQSMPSDGQNYKYVHIYFSDTDFNAQLNRRQEIFTNRD